MFLTSYLNLEPTSKHSSNCRETKKALNTIGRFLRSETGTSWLSGLAQTKSGPLTTAELMNQLVKSTKPDGKVFKSAKKLLTALETQKLENGGSGDEPDAWDDLIKDIENQEDIICLYRKDSDSSMRKADDWKKFLKSVSSGYTVHLALDKGQKYVICLKKINVSDSENSSTTSSLETTTKDTSKETDKEDLEETTDNENILETTTEMDQMSEITENPEPKLKVSETRKSGFGPGFTEIREAELESESECSDEDDNDEEDIDSEDGHKNSERFRNIEKVVESTVEADTGKDNHQQCNRPIIVMMPNPYGAPGSPNWISFMPQIPKRPLQQPAMANQVQRFNEPASQPSFNTWNRWTWRNSYANSPQNNYRVLNPGIWRHHHHQPSGMKIHKTVDDKRIKDFRNPSYANSPQNDYRVLNPGIWRHHHHHPSGLKNHKTVDDKRIKDFRNPIGFNVEIQKLNKIPDPPRQSFHSGKKPQSFDYTLKSVGHNSKPIELHLKSSNQKQPPKDNLPKPSSIFRPRQSLYLANPKFPLESNLYQVPNSGLRPSIAGPNSVSPLVSLRADYPSNISGNKYNSLSLYQMPCLMSTNKNPQYQGYNPYQFGKVPMIVNQYQGYNRYQFGKVPLRVNQNTPGYQYGNPLNVNSNGQIENVKLNPYWLNQPRFSSNQNSPDTQIFFNSESPLRNSGASKCPSLCDHPIELRISVEGNVDKPVKIGISSQPGTWINIVDDKLNSRRMIDNNEEVEADENEESVEEETAEDDEESYTDNFKDELIQNQGEKKLDDKQDEKVSMPKDESPKENSEPAKNKSNEEKQKDEDKGKNPVARVLPVIITTTPDIKPTDITQPPEITTPAA